MKNIKRRLLTFTLVALATLFTVSPGAYAATTISIGSPSSNRTITSDTFTVSGTATPNRSITVTVDGTEAATTTSNNDGNWSVELTDQEAGEKTIEATASGHLLYTNILDVSTMSARMARLNTLTGEEESSFDVTSGGAFAITWKPNSTFTKAYGVAPYLNSGTVWVMDLVNGSFTTFTLPGVNPRGAAVAYNEDDSKVYITDNENTTVYVYNTATNTQMGGGLAIGDAPHSNAYRPNSDEVWVLNSLDSTISVISTISDTVVDTYNTSAADNGLSFSPDGSLAYVGITGGVEILDAATGTSLDIMTGTDTPEYMITNHAGTKLYVSHPAGTTIDVFDLASQTLEETITVPDGPWGIAVTPDDSTVYLASPHLGVGLTGTTISVIDAATNTISDTWPVTGGAPFHVFLAPVESASDTLTITVGSGLAETGVGTLTQTIVALLLISGAALVAHKSRAQRFAVSRASFKAKRR